jgi:hypothetical protein
LGAIVFISYRIENDYFFIPFSDLISIITSIIVGYFIAKYIGEKLNKYNKLLETVDQLITKIEDNIEQIVEILRTLVEDKSNDSKKKASINKLFTLTSILLNLIKETNNNELVNHRLLIEQIYKSFGIFYDYTLGDNFTNLAKSDVDYIKEVALKSQEILKDIYLLRLKLYS